MAEVYKVPSPGFDPRGVDIDKNGVVWTALAASSHMASFDRRKCKDLRGPRKIDGSQCAEGWTLYQTGGPKFKGTNIPTDFHYYNWVDQHNIIGFGENTPFANGSNSDSLIALNPKTREWTMLRVPYPLGLLLARHGRPHRRSEGRLEGTRPLRQLRHALRVAHRGREGNARQGRQVPDATRSARALAGSRQPGVTQGGPFRPALFAYGRCYHPSPGGAIMPTYGLDTERHNESFIAAYEHVCTSYHALDDFRMKLLGALPIASVIGLFALNESGLASVGGVVTINEVVAYVGVFAALFTLSLFVYEIRGILMCHDLIMAGLALEDDLHVRGQFTVRLEKRNLPCYERGWKRRIAKQFNAVLAACWIYSLVFTAWLFIALRYGFAIHALTCALVAAGVGLILGTGTYGLLRWLTASNEPPLTA